MEQTNHGLRYVEISCFNLFQDSTKVEKLYKFQPQISSKNTLLRLLCPDDLLGLILHDKAKRIIGCGLKK